MNERKTNSHQQSKFSWFFNGIVLSVLVFASANALSLFVRSGGWHPLIDTSKAPQAIGFPFEIWRLGDSYGDGAFIDHFQLSLNGLFALFVGAVIGVLFVAYSERLNSFMQFMVERELKSVESQSLQFSLGGMLIFTGVVAAVFAAIRASLGASPTLLLGIYLLGPSMLIILAMIPKGLSWQARIVLLTPSTLLLIGFAMFVGYRLELPFDIVMLGIFSCWVPQSVIGATFLIIGLWIQFSRHAVESESPGPVHSTNR